MSTPPKYECKHLHLDITKLRNNKRYRKKGYIPKLPCKDCSLMVYVHQKEDGHWVPITGDAPAPPAFKYKPSECKHGQEEEEEITDGWLLLPGNNDPDYEFVVVTTTKPRHCPDCGDVFAFKDRAVHKKLRHAKPLGIFDFKPSDCKHAQLDTSDVPVDGVMTRLPCKGCGSMVMAGTDRNGKYIALHSGVNEPGGSFMWYYTYLNFPALPAS